MTFPTHADILTQHRPYGLDCACGRPINSNADWARHVDQVWREVRMIETVEELESLPVGAVVMPLWHLDAGPCQRLTDGWFMALSDKPVNPLGTGRKGETALVVWQPDWSNQ